MAEISKIKLPSGTTYDIKDETARELIKAGVTFIIAWNGAEEPNAAAIPEGVIVKYNGNTVTGTLAASSITAGAFYLVKSSTTPSEDLDIYDEYVVIKPDTQDSATWFWEKVGDTKLNLTDVVTGVSLEKDSINVIGANATLKNTQPAITLAANDSAANGKVAVLTDVNSTDTNIKATASGANTAWNSKDSANAVTGYPSPNTDTFVKGISTTSKQLKTTSITGVSGSSTASKATAGANQTTATGAGKTSTANTDWLKGVSVSDETLVIGAATLTTQTTTQYTFSDVTVPNAASATTIATGEVVDADDKGATIVTAASVNDSAKAMTGLGTPNTKSVIGADASFTVTQPSIALEKDVAAAADTVTVSKGVSSTTKYVGATATGGGTDWDNKNSVTVLGNATSLNVAKGS